MLPFTLLGTLGLPALSGANPLGGTAFPDPVSLSHPKDLRQDLVKRLAKIQTSSVSNIP